MRSQVIPSGDYRREPWQNGLGWTREIYRHDDGNDWDWRVSQAEIDESVRFSRFSGIDRELALLSGDGLCLHFDEDDPIFLSPPRQRHRFAGEHAVRAELTDGPVRVFNLMWRRERISTGLWHRPLVGSMVLFVEPGEVWVVHLIAGRMGFAANDHLPQMQGGDTALLCAGAADGRVRYAIDGGGEALLARISTI